MLKTVVIFISLMISTYSFNQTTLFTEDFQDGIPNTWTIVDNDGLTPYFNDYSNAWVSVVDPENMNDTVASSTSYFTPIGRANRWLITPSITLGNFGNTISWNVKSQDASFPDSYVVLVSSTDNQISSFTDTIASIQGESFEWTKRIANLSDFGFNNQSVYVAFVNNTYDGYKLYLDSVSVEIDDASGINEITSEKLSIYPNPTSESLTIKGFESTLEMSKIYDQIGNVIMVSSNSTIDVTTLITGIYFIEVKTLNSVIKKKFIKY